MRMRILVAAAVAAGLAAAPVAGAAGPAVLDGKKTKVLTLTADGGVQDHDVDAAEIIEGSDRVNCSAPRCAVLPFVFSPAKGVSGGAMFTLTWASPLSDFDLYVAQVGSNGRRTQIASCGGVGTTSEKIYVAPGVLKAGKTYALVADFYRSAAEKATAKVEFPAKSTVSKDVPADAEVVYPINCTL